MPQTIAVDLENGLTTVMVMIDKAATDEAIQAEIDKTGFDPKPVGWRRIRLAESDEIMARWPKQRRAPAVRSDDGVNVQITEGGPDYLPILEALATKLEELSERNAALESNVGTLNAVIDAIADKAREQSHEDQ